MRRPVMSAATCAAIVALAGCGTDTPPVSPGCTENGAIVRKALRSAPAVVTLPDSTRLSQCISRGTGNADLQNVGIVFYGVAEELRTAARAGDRAAALQLGYLIGATRRGAKRTNGVMAELQRRIELVGSRLDDQLPGSEAAVARGLRAGEASG